ncbi:hypothetical protein Taro_045623 [Colocasia esculenta]|uniref:Uncharacterized protein n=1 Tax=Colocasia esculenta TaxID=4460 RepID=A0A843WML5_COLES|nr:hypothetical protein [Colocasia esculenta]
MPVELSVPLKTHMAPLLRRLHLIAVHYPTTKFVRSLLFVILLLKLIRSRGSRETMMRMRILVFRMTRSMFIGETGVPVLEEDIVRSDSEREE